jgi:hypothetical protein
MSKVTNDSLNQVRTKCGILDARVKMTIHCDWMTYVHVRETGKLGMEDIFASAYGKTMEMTESPNDTDYSWDIKKEKLSEYDLKAVEESINRGWFPDYYLRMMLIDLCNKEIIPEAHYVIRMSW